MFLPKIESLPHKQEEGQHAAPRWGPSVSVGTVGSLARGMGEPSGSGIQAHRVRSLQPY